MSSPIYRANYVLLVVPHEVEPWFHFWYRGRVESLDTIATWSGAVSAIHSKYLRDHVTGSHLRENMSMEEFIDKQNIRGFLIKKTVIFWSSLHHNLTLLFFTRISLSLWDIVCFTNYEQCLIRTLYCDFNFGKPYNWLRPMFLCSCTWSWHRKSWRVPELQLEQDKISVKWVSLHYQMQGDRPHTILCIPGALGFRGNSLQAQLVT